MQRLTHRKVPGGAEQTRSPNSLWPSGAPGPAPPASTSPSPPRCREGDAGAATPDPGLPGNLESARDVKAVESGSPPALAGGARPAGSGLASGALPDGTRAHEG